MRIKYLGVLFFLTLMISACSNDIEPKEQVGDIYSVALNSIMEHNPELNSDMEFIAIYVSGYEEISESDKEEILSYFNKNYDVDVMITDDTVEELKETELYNPNTSSLKGVFLSIEKVDSKDNNQIVFEGTKYRSNTEGFLVQVTVQYKDNNWQTSDVEELWRLSEPIN